MRAYPHIIKKVYYEPLALTMAKFMAVHAVIESRLTATHTESFGDRPPRIEDLHMLRDGSTAIIPVNGLIAQHIAPVDTMSSGPMTDVDDLKSQIDVAEQDPTIDRVLFTFDTPGGNATGVPETGRKILNMTKPTVAFTDAECCSAGLWLASQANHFYATPSASIGSVGVWSAYTDLTKKMEKEGVKINAVSAGKYKLMGAWWKPMENDERDMLQAHVDKLHGEFKSAVNNVRQVDAKYLEGQIFDGEKATEIGMTDGLVEDVVELLS